MNVRESLTHGKAEYDAAFAREREVIYPAVDEFETRYGFGIDPGFLLDAARVLACPVKVNPPNWQHGRVLYAALRDYFSRNPLPTCVLDIGTAKGFSAVCMARAIDDAGRADRVLSVDIVFPSARVRRNSVLEVSGAVLELFTIEEFTRPFLGRTRPTFVGDGAKAWLLDCYRQGLHVGFAFVDGKHTYEAVQDECRMLSKMQRAGDVIVFDDANLPQIAAAIGTLGRKYQLTPLRILPNRAYVLADKIK